MDGDTFTMIRHKSLNFIELLRLIGVDAPNSKDSDEKLEYFGNEAADFARSILENRKCALSYDQTPVDTYGRILGYVWVPATFEETSTRYCSTFFLLLMGTATPIQSTLLKISIWRFSLKQKESPGLISKVCGLARSLRICCLNLNITRLYTSQMLAQCIIRHIVNICFKARLPLDFLKPLDADTHPAMSAIRLD